MSLDIELLGYVPLSIAIAGICAGFSVPCFKYAFTGRELGEKYSEGASKIRCYVFKSLFILKRQVKQNSWDEKCAHKKTSADSDINAGESEES